MKTLPAIAATASTKASRAVTGRPHRSGAFGSAGARREEVPLLLVHLATRAHRPDPFGRAGGGVVVMPRSSRRSRRLQWLLGLWNRELPTTIELVYLLEVVGPHPRVMNFRFLGSDPRWPWRANSIAARSVVADSTALLTAQYSLSVTPDFCTACCCWDQLWTIALGGQRLRSREVFDDALPSIAEQLLHDPRTLFGDLSSRLLQRTILPIDLQVAQAATPSHTPPAAEINTQPAIRRTSRLGASAGVDHAHLGAQQQIRERPVPLVAQRPQPTDEQRRRIQEVRQVAHQQSDTAGGLPGRCRHTEFR